MTNYARKIFTTALCAATALSCPQPAVAADEPAKPVDAVTELFGNPVIARGGGVEVKRADLDSAMLNVRTMAAAQGMSVPRSQEAEIEKGLLARLIYLQLVLKKATDADRTEGHARAEKKLETVYKRATSEELLAAQLKAMGLTKDEFVSRITEESVAEVATERELSISISDTETREYYDGHPSQFEEPERVKASHILLLTQNPATRSPLGDEQKAGKRKLAEELVKRARAGEEFSKLVAEYSEDPTAKQRGGEITFPRGAQGIPPEFAAAAFTLNTNQISDVVTTAIGYHVIKVSEVLPARKVSYEEVVDDLKQMLRQRQTVEKLPAFMTKLRKEAQVEVLDENLVFDDEEEQGSTATPGATGASKPSTQ